MTVFLILRWNTNLDQYIVNPRTIETKVVTDPEADVQPITELTDPEADVQPITELKEGQLEFTEEILTDTVN